MSKLSPHGGIKSFGKDNDVYEKQKITTIEMMCVDYGNFYDGGGLDRL